MQDPIFAHERARQPDGVVDAARAGRDAAVNLAHALAHAGRVSGAALHTQLEERPYLAMAAVAGAGFVVAGGLSTPLARGVASLGARLVVATLVERLIDVVAAAAAPETPPT